MVSCALLTGIMTGAVRSIPRLGIPGFRRGRKALSRDLQNRVVASKQSLPALPRGSRKRALHSRVALMTAGYRLGAGSLHSRFALTIAGRKREVALFVGASGSCRRGLHGKAGDEAWTQ